MNALIFYKYVSLSSKALCFKNFTDKKSKTKGIQPFMYDIPSVYGNMEHVNEKLSGTK